MDEEKHKYRGKVIRRESGRKGSRARSPTKDREGFRSEVGLLPLSSHTPEKEEDSFPFPNFTRSGRGPEGQYLGSQINRTERRGITLSKPWHGKRKSKDLAIRPPRE